MVAPDRHRAVALPADTIAEGVRRLGWIALVYAIGYIAGSLTRLILTGVRGTIDSYGYVIPDVFGLGAVIMALAIFAAFRSSFQANACGYSPTRSSFRTLRERF